MKGINNIFESFKTRQVKYGGFSVLITLALIAGLILVNLMAGQLSLEADLTESKIYSLSEQTVQVLESVSTPVRFYGLWKPGDESQDVMTVVNHYLERNSNITMEVIDPDRNPGFVVRYDKNKTGIARGSLIVEGEKGSRVISPYDMYEFTQDQQGQRTMTGVSVERRITSALLYVGTGTTPVVYELSGHSELPLLSIGIQELLDRENLSLKSVNLFVSPVPSDASALILHGPRNDLAPVEAEKLLEYLGKGGRLLVLADYNIGELPNLNEVLESYGLRFEYGIVHETNPRYFTLDPRLEIPDMAEHDITMPLMNKDQTPIIMPTAMSLAALDVKRRTVEIKPLMISSSDSFLRADVNETSAVRLVSDIPGPLTLAAAVMDPSWVQGSEPQARIVVIGSSGLLPIFLQSGNQANCDFFMNSLVWLEDRPESISVRSKSLYLLPVRLNLVQLIIFGSLFILIIPVAFFVTGFVTWLKRRHL